MIQLYRVHLGTVVDSQHQGRPVLPSPRVGADSLPDAHDNLWTLKWVLATSGRSIWSPLHCFLYEKCYQLTYSTLHLNGHSNKMPFQFEQIHMRVPLK
jgi:hypothetical protein